MNSEEASFKRAKKDLLTSMPATIKDAVIVQTSSDIHDVGEIQAWAELNSVNHQIDEAARLSLPSGFSLIKIKRNK